MVAVISVDAYPFLAFSDETYHLEDKEVGVFCCILQPDNKETELGNSDLEASPSEGKNTRVVLVPCCSWKCVPTVISGGIDISEVPGCHFFSVKVTKITLKIGVS